MCDTDYLWNILQKSLYPTLQTELCILSKGGRDSKKKCRLKRYRYYSILPGESIDKATVSLQIPEVLNNEAIKVLLCKNLNRQRDCIVSNPRIFKGEAIQVLLHPKI